MARRPSNLPPRQYVAVRSWRSKARINLVASGPYRTRSSAQTDIKRDMRYHHRIDNSYYVMVFNTYYLFKVKPHPGIGEYGTSIVAARSLEHAQELFIKHHPSYALVDFVFTHVPLEPGVLLDYWE